MEQTHLEPMDQDGPRVLARGRGASDFQVELLQVADGSIAVAFGVDSDGGIVRQWPAGDVENGVRTFLSLVRRRGVN